MNGRCRGGARFTSGREPLRSAGSFLVDSSREPIMKTFVIVPLWAAALLTTAATASSAQNTAGDQEKGSTGWSGGAKDQVGQSAPGSQSNPAKGKTGPTV